MPDTPHSPLATKRPKDDLNAFLQAVDKNDNATVERLKALYQVAGGTNDTLHEEIKWHVTQQYFKENPLR